jgi:cytochrome c biogenesis protein CcmG/thiol:disulfide interchange protein DsbE
MKLHVRPLVLTAGLLLSLNALAEPAPEFTLPDAAGQTISLSQQRGKIVYVDFWASWCGPCRQSFPWMNEMLGKYQAQGLEIVAINLDTGRAEADEFLAKNPASFTVLFDPTATLPRNTV